MMRRGLLHADQFGNRGVAEPRELLKRQKQFAVPEKQPKAVLGNVSYFYGRSASATLPGFHLRAPAQPKRSGKPRGAQPVVLCDSNLWLKPELSFAGFVMSVNVHPWRFPGEEVEPVASRPEDRRTHCTILPDRLPAPPWNAARGLTSDHPRNRETG